MDTQTESNKPADRKDYEDELERYLNQELVISISGESIMGVMNSINYQAGEVLFLPVLTFEPDGERVYVEREFPVSVSLSRLRGEKADRVIRRLKKGFLEDRAKEINRLADRKSGITGFRNPSE